MPKLNPGFAYLLAEGEKRGQPTDPRLSAEDRAAAAQFERDCDEQQLPQSRAYDAGQHHGLIGAIHRQRAISAKYGGIALP